jgi:hypothetical protein
LPDKNSYKDESEVCQARPYWHLSDELVHFRV